MVAYDTWHAPVRECVCEAVRLTLFACTLLFGYLLGYLVSVACFPPQNQMSCHCMSFTKVRPVEVLDQSFIRCCDAGGAEESAPPPPWHRLIPTAHVDTLPTKFTRRGSGYQAATPHAPGIIKE